MPIRQTLGTTRVETLVLAAPAVATGIVVRVENVTDPIVQKATALTAIWAGCGR